MRGRVVLLHDALRAGLLALLARERRRQNRFSGEGQTHQEGSTTQDVDFLAERMVARGGKLDQEPRDQPWGVRDFALTDPDGFKITTGAEKS